MKAIPYNCRCDDDKDRLRQGCGAVFQIAVVVEDRYDSVLIKHCPLCGHSPVFHKRVPGTVTSITVSS